MLCAGITKSQIYEDLSEIGMLSINQNGSLFQLTILWLELTNASIGCSSGG